MEMEGMGITCMNWPRGNGFRTLGMVQSCGDGFCFDTLQGSWRGLRLSKGLVLVGPRKTRRGMRSSRLHEDCDDLIRLPC